MVVIKGRIIAKPREGTRPIYRIRPMIRQQHPQPLIEESLGKA